MNTAVGRSLGLSFPPALREDRELASIGDAMQGDSAPSSADTQPTPAGTPAARANRQGEKSRQLSLQEIERLRRDSYNATAFEIIDVTETLKLFRVRPDREIPHFEPGQYFSLGLGYWEPRIAGVEADLVSPERERALVKRAYSISCTLAAEGTRVRRPREYDYLEFYVTLAPQVGPFPPALTPRLFALQAPARLFLAEKAHGRYSLSAVCPETDVWFFATGTGEAPHNAMIAELLGRDHGGRVVHVHCVRRRRDAAYQASHAALAATHPRYHYVLSTTREPENVDPSLPNYVGKQYLQTMLQSGLLERMVGFRLNPEVAHAFVCGSPSMVGAPPRGHHGTEADPKPGGMLDILTNLGFRLDRMGRPGNAHWEEYD